MCVNNNKDLNMSYVFTFSVAPEFDKLQILDIMNLHISSRSDITLFDFKDYLALADDPVLLPKKTDNLIGFYIPLSNSYPHVFLDTIIHFSLLYGCKEDETYTNEQMPFVFINGYKYFISENNDMINKIEHKEFITFDDKTKLIFSPVLPYVTLDSNEKLVNFLILQNTLFKNNQIVDKNSNSLIL